MKKTFTQIALLLTICFSAQAQNYVTIPDPNFVSFLQSLYPSCMNGNQMNTSCNDIQNELWLDVSFMNISDLTGIQYFTSLQELYCDGDSLTTLPALPNTLLSLYCNENKLTSLPSLPSSLLELECWNNQLTSLPSLPPSLYYLGCANNQLTSLPLLPALQQNNMYYYNFLLSCENNNISCFPPFPQDASVILDGNPFTCLPNYISTMDATLLAYPLCVPGDLVNNPYGCFAADGFLGYVYKDDNGNCLKDSNEMGLENIKVKVYDANNNLRSQSISDANGKYYFFDTAGTYTILIDTAGLTLQAGCSSPGIDSTITTTAANPSVAVNFDFVCPSVLDIGTRSVITSGWVFPGEDHVLTVVAGDLSQWYNLNCATGIGGQVEITVTGPVSYNGIPSGALTPSVSGNTYTYTVANFGNINIEEAFKLVFKTDTTAQGGDQVCVNVSVTPMIGDGDVENNTYQTCYQVINSYDPNVKEVYPVNVDPGYAGWFTYTIHFQNTGTAPAFNIRLADTLDNNLDLETFKVTNYSHYNTVSINNGLLSVRFPNIMLPDSTSDEEGSHGFVQYRVKPKANLPAGTQIRNTAYIYFDYNAPVVTNTTVNEFVLPASIHENKIIGQLNVYPNPSNGMYNVILPEGVDASSSTIEVFNLFGEKIYGAKAQNNISQLDIHLQPVGIYIVRVKDAKYSFNQRIIKQ